MKMHEIVGTANDAAFQRLLVREQLRSNGARNTWTIGEASITAEPARHRTGIPADAVCLRYVFEHPEAGWTFSGRAVWRMGQLFKPWGTHIRIERYWDDAERYGSDDAVAEAVSLWFQNL